MDYHGGTKRIVMNRVEVADLADELLEYHRDNLLIDPFVKISIEIAEGDFISVCTKDSKSSLSWIIKINPERHSDIFDIQYSILSGLITTLFENVYCGLDDLRRSALDAAIARLSSALAQSYEDEEEDDDEED